MHIPVLRKEVLGYLDPKPNENFIDCTIGEGGHTIAILEKNKPDGKILGIDRDREQIENWELKIENFKNRVILVCGSYVNLREIVGKNKFEKVSGILFDLGMSSWHLEKSGRGFSFLRDEPLDMRYSLDNDLTAEKILNNYSQKEIERILKEYGEERYANKLSRKIVQQRPIKSTLQLVEVIRKAKVFSIARIFQALRIAVNDELNNLKNGLTQATEVLATEGRIVVISYHSLEDRIVKNFFKEENFKILTRKPIKPSEQEIKDNPRSRSAKLRAAIKL